MKAHDPELVRAYVDLAGLFHEAKVAVTFRLDELVTIAIDVDDDNIRERVLTAISLVDDDLASRLRVAMREAPPPQ